MGGCRGVVYGWVQGMKNVSVWVYGWVQGMKNVSVWVHGMCNRKSAQVSVYLSVCQLANNHRQKLWPSPLVNSKYFPRCCKVRLIVQRLSACVVLLS